MVAVDAEIECPKPIKKLFQFPIKAS